jgi:hypothetical protein
VESEREHVGGHGARRIESERATGVEHGSIGAASRELGAGEKAEGSRAELVVPLAERTKLLRAFELSARAQGASRVE